MVKNANILLETKYKGGRSQTEKIHSLLILFIFGYT